MTRTKTTAIGGTSQYLASDGLHAFLQVSGRALSFKHIPTKSEHEKIIWSTHLPVRCGEHRCPPIRIRTSWTVKSNNVETDVLAMTTCTGKCALVCVVVHSSPRLNPGPPAMRQNTVGRGVVPQIRSALAGRSLPASSRRHNLPQPDQGSAAADPRAIGIFGGNYEAPVRWTAP